MAEPHIIILISANAEWRAVKELLAPAQIHTTPMGEYFDFKPGTPSPVTEPLLIGTPGTRPLGPGVRYFHGGWGKISAAATTQYVIDHFQPELLINLGTCGGFDGRIERGTILLVTRTIVYDIIEQMSEPEAALAHYATELDLSWLDNGSLAMDHDRLSVVHGLLVSADRDIVPADIAGLVEKYGAVAADWETGAIAWVAKQNGVRCLILRGVTDLVGSSGGEAYGNIQVFHDNTKTVMKTLIESLPEWFNRIKPSAYAPNALIDKVDCLRLYVPDLESGLNFYCEHLGQQLIWRTATAAGLRLPGSEAELVLQSERKGQEVDLTVYSADEAARRFVEAGGRLRVAPFEIRIGRACVVEDPWGNPLVLLDTNKGLLKTDEDGNVVGNI
jgi:adenosylhomocysteine nucleosidase